MVDNKSETSLIGHIQKKYITHKDSQYNTHAKHSYNIVIITCDIFFLYMSFLKFSYFINILTLWKEEGRQPEAAWLYSMFWLPVRCRHCQYTVCIL